MDADITLCSCSIPRDQASKRGLVRVDPSTGAACASDADSLMSTLRSAHSLAVTAHAQADCKLLCPFFWSMHSSAPCIDMLAQLAQAQSKTQGHTWRLHMHTPHPSPTCLA